MAQNSPMGVLSATSEAMTPLFRNNCHDEDKVTTNQDQGVGWMKNVPGQR